MAEKSTIQWTNSSWTPIRARVRADAGEIAKQKGYTSLVQIADKMAGHVGPHCEHASAGCDHCYSETNNGRCLPHNGTGLPFDRRSRDLVDIFLDENILVQPLRWKRPRNIFVCSQTDWAAEFVPDNYMDRILAVAALCPQHTFQFLTKRADRLPEYLLDPDRREQVEDAGGMIPGGPCYANTQAGWPLPNCHIGFSAEDQPNFDARWEHIRKLAAAGWSTWCSYEPALGPLDASAALGWWRCDECGQAMDMTRERLAQGAPMCDSCENPDPLEVAGNYLRWIVVGGESGPGARACQLEWIGQIVEQGAATAMPVFVKQAGSMPITGLPTGGRLLGNVALNANGYYVAGWEVKLKDRKGGDPPLALWPTSLVYRR